MAIHIHLPGVTRIDLCDLLGVRRMLHKIFGNTERLIEMSGSLKDQLEAAQAETNAKLDAIATDVTDISADVDTLLGGMSAGDQITQAQVDAATSIRDRVGALKDALDAINAKVPPATPAS